MSKKDHTARARNLRMKTNYRKLNLVRIDEWVAPEDRDSIKALAKQSRERQKAKFTKITLEVFVENEA